MSDAVKLVRTYHDVTFILLHAGMLEDRSEAGWDYWRTAMRQLAGCPNLAVKLSGLGTFDRACSAERWRPVIEETIDLFGPARCLFDPRNSGRAARLVGTVRECLSRYSQSEQHAVLHDTAARLYRL
jgi:predicted TIM-barrel fold metal-dependent hydrolase